MRREKKIVHHQLRIIITITRWMNGWKKENENVKLWIMKQKFKASFMRNYPIWYTHIWVEKNAPHANM